MASRYSLGEHYKACARDLVASGRYDSVNEVLRDGMRLIDERQALRQWKLDDLKKAIQEGMDSGPSEL